MAYELLLAKTEVTEGTAPAMTAADAVWAENVQFKDLGTRKTLNPAKPGLGANPGVVTGVHAEITFDVLLVGGGDPGVAPAYGFLLKACGWGEDIEATESVTYARLADPALAPSVALKWSQERQLHVMVGARGKVDIKATPGEPLRASFLIRGILGPVAQRAWVTSAEADFADWPTAKPIDHDNTTFELDGEEVVLRDLTATGADNVKFIDLPGQKAVVLKGPPAPTGSIKANVPLLADFNPELAWRDQSRHEFALTYGTEAGSIVTVSGVVQLDTPAWSKEDEFHVVTSSTFFVGSSDTSSDDLVIVIT